MSSSCVSGHACVRTSQVSVHLGMLKAMSRLTACQRSKASDLVSEQYANCGINSGQDECTSRWSICGVPCRRAFEWTLVFGCASPGRTSGCRTELESIRPHHASWAIHQVAVIVPWKACLAWGPSKDGSKESYKDGPIQAWKRSGTCKWAQRRQDEHTCGGRSAYAPAIFLPLEMLRSLPDATPKARARGSATTAAVSPPYTSFTRLSVLQPLINREASPEFLAGACMLAADAWTGHFLCASL